MSTLTLRHFRGALKKDLVVSLSFDLAAIARLQRATGAEAGESACPTVNRGDL